MSLYLLLLGRKESPHHYIPSAQASLAQPDLQLVGHSNTHSAPPKCFSRCLRANRSCQTLPGTLFPGFLFCRFGCPRGHSGTKLLSPTTWPHTKSQLHLFRKYNDPGNLHACPRLDEQVTKPLPIPHILTIIAKRCWPLAPVESAAEGRPPLPPPAGAKILWENVLFTYTLVLRVTSICISTFTQLFHIHTIPEESLVLLCLSYFTNINISWNYLALL